MELTSQVLRQVEFAPERLPGRGYKTSEVDDFLESAALAIDKLREEMGALRERADRAERLSTERTDADDEESIRRTLVLAQRTADLAIKEAQEEAAQLLDGARSDAESIVADARQSAERITAEADRKLKEEVARLTIDRDRLRGEIDALVGLLNAERDRLAESLTMALRLVEKSLTASPELAALASPQPPAAAPQPVAPPVAPAADRIDPDVDELEAAIAEDAAAAAPSLPPRFDEAGDSWEAEERLARPSLMALPSLDEALESGDAPAGEATASWRVTERANSPAS